MEHTNARRFSATAIFCVVGAACLLLLLPKDVFAASLYIDPNQTELNRGDTISLAVRLDVDEDECVNVIDASISYSEIIRAVDVSRGDSILSLWLEDPVIDEENHRITFAGGIPNGYCGRILGDPRLTNVVAEIIFRSPGFAVGRGDDTAARISFDETTRVFLNDGLGTEAPLVTFGAEIELSKTPGATTIDEWTNEVNADERPPEEFSIALVQQDDIFAGKYYIVFNTTDKQSGIDHYEVIEEPLEESSLFKWGAANAPWVETKSPYVLKDQKLKSTIRVRAIDKAGNERIATLVPDKTLQQGFLILNVVIGVILLAALGLIVFVIVKTIRRRKQESKVEEDNEEKDVE